VALKFDEMTAAELKDLCKEKNLKQSGKKADLEDRLCGYFYVLTKNRTNGIPLEAEELDKMPAAELKKHCEEFRLKPNGKKSDLQERLRNYLNDAAGGPLAPVVAHESDEYESMSLDDLRHSLITRGLSSQGTKKEMIARLREDTKTIEELTKAVPQERFDSIVSVLQASLKDSKVITEFLKKKQSAPAKKHVEVTITSLGLEPEKYTAGGAPSVTADVLRTLAGDPFADPPKYGTVSRFKRESALRCYIIGS